MRVRLAPSLIRAPLALSLLTMFLFHLSAAPISEAFRLVPDEQYPLTVCSMSGKTCATIHEFVDDSKPSWLNKTYSIELPASENLSAGCVFNIPYEATSKNVLVLDNGHGVVGLHVWKNSVTDGKSQESVMLRTSCKGPKVEVHRDSLLAHVSPTLPQISYPGARRSWFNVAWIEHSKNRYHHLVPTGEILSVDLVSGNLQKLPKSELTRGISYTRGKERLMLLQNAIGSDSPGIRQLSKRLAMDETEATDIRLPAAYFAREELPRGLAEQLFLETARTDNDYNELVGAREYALRHLAEVIGLKRAEQTLVEVLSTSESAKTTFDAALALGKIGSCKAANPLHSAVRHKSDYVAHAALYALRAICPLDIKERLSELSRQSTSLQKILDHLLNPEQTPEDEICVEREANPYGVAPLPRYQDCGTRMRVGVVYALGVGLFAEYP